MIGRCDDSVEVWQEGSVGRKRSCKRDRHQKREEDDDVREPLHEANHQAHQAQQNNQARTRSEMSPLRARGAHDFAPFPKRVSPSRGSTITSSAVPTTATVSDREPERERRRERLQRHRRPPRRRPHAPSKENHPASIHDRQYIDDYARSIQYEYECDNDTLYIRDSRDNTPQTSNMSKLTDEPMRTHHFSELHYKETGEPLKSFFTREEDNNIKSNDYFYVAPNYINEFNPIGQTRNQPIFGSDLDYIYGENDLHSVTEKILDKKDDRDRSPSPLPKPISPNKAPHIDLNTLHEQLGPTEPVRSMPTKLIAFPWRPDTDDFMEPLIKSRHMSSKNHHIDSYVPETIAGSMAMVFNKVSNKKDTKKTDIEDPQSDIFTNERDETLDKIIKKIQALKRKLLKYESEFEQLNGFRISQADKMNHPILSKMYSELHHLKLDKKRIQNDDTESITMEKKKPVKEIWDECNISFSSDKSMAELVADIEKWVETRASVGGGGLSGVAAEKAALQVALLRLEAARGRPGRVGPERPVARPLYDRYRALKRMLKSEERNENPAISSIVGELETIMEHEALLLTSTSVDSSSDSQERQSDDTDDKADNKDATKVTSPKTDSEDASSSNKSTASEEIQPSYSQASSMYTNESLHCLPYNDLSKLLSDARVQKSNLRTSIKTKEIEFEIINNRKLLKDERPDLEQEYVKYKEIKARIRLLTALVNKHKKMVVDQ